MSDLNDIAKLSVRKNDLKLDAPYNGVLRFVLAGSSFQSNPPVLPLFPPPYWSRLRDRVLRGTVHAESMWASAVGIAITKMASKGWNVDGASPGDAPTTTKRTQALFHGAEFGKGWVHCISRGLRDYLTTDNGAFLEIIRETERRSSRIKGLAHLDSLRCWRTGNPERPVVYEDQDGHYHELYYHEVIELCDMPDSSDDYHGVGFCAASRAYRAIAKLASIEQYFLEKVTGSRANEIHFINNVTEAKVRSALSTADAEQLQRGAYVYKGVVVVASMGDQQISGYRIPLAEVPDGFDRDGEFNKALLTYADAIGLDIQDLQPLTGQALGTGAQSRVLDDKARGKGLASWEVQLEHQINEKVTAQSVTWQFIERDWRDRQQEADYQRSVVDTLIAASDPEGGFISSDQALQIAVDKEVMPREFLAVDQTPDVSLADDEKPEEIQPIRLAGAINAEQSAHI